MVGRPQPPQLLEETQQLNGNGIKTKLDVCRAQLEENLLTFFKSMATMKAKGLKKLHRRKTYPAPVFRDFLATCRADSGHASLADQAGDRLGKSAYLAAGNVTRARRPAIGCQSGSGLLVAFCAATSALLARSPVANISGVATESALAPNRPGESDQARRHNSQVPPNQHAAMGTNAATSGS